ncbi:MAG: DMT family transporter [Acidimicrobiia bacterium]
MEGDSLPVSRANWAPVTAVLSAAALFGTTGTALARGPENTDAWAAASLRLCLGGGLLALIAGRRLATAIRHRRWALTGAVGVAVYQTMFFAATDRTGVAVAALATIGTSPLASRAIGRLRGRPAPAPIWWLAAGVLGVGLTLQFVAREGTSMTERSIDPSGVLFAVVAGVMYAVYAEAGAVLIERGVQSTASMATIFVGGAILTSPILAFADLDWFFTPRGAPMIAYQGIITLTLAYVAFGWGLRHLAPSIVVMLTVLEPAVASLLAVVLLDESLSPGAWIGAGLIFAGLPIAGLAATGSTVEP